MEILISSNSTLDPLRLSLKLDVWMQFCQEFNSWITLQNIQMNPQFFQQHFFFQRFLRLKTNMWWSTKRLGWSIFNQSKAAYRNIGERKIKMGGQRWLLLITNMGLIHHVISNRWSFLTYYSSSQSFAQITRKK